MPLDEFIINIHLNGRAILQLNRQKPLRRGGFAPKLSDTEVICLEIVGEFMDTCGELIRYFHCFGTLVRT